jgi:hypothetical protein
MKKTFAIILATLITICMFDIPALATAAEYFENGNISEVDEVTEGGEYSVDTTTDNYDISNSVYTHRVTFAENAVPSGNLLDLEIIEQTESFEFKPYTYDYPNVTVLPTTRTITIKPTAAAGIITVDGEVVTSGTTSNQIILEPEGASKIIRIAVREIGKLRTDYSITVTRVSPGPSNDLENLVMSGEPENYRFSPGIYNYPSVTVSTTTLTVALKPTAKR